MVLLDELGTPREPRNKIVTPLDQLALEARTKFKVPVGNPPSDDKWVEALKFRQALSPFLAREGALVMVRKNHRDDMAISNTGYQIMLA